MNASRSERTTLQHILPAIVHAHAARRLGKVVAAVVSMAGIAAAMGMAAPASAATATGSFNVTATVQATCLISGTNLAFGVYTGVVATSTSILSVTCTNTTPYTVGLGAGLGVGATVTSRKMTGLATATLNYVMTSDAPHVTNWGMTPSTDTIPGVGSGASQPLTVYGQIAAGQYVAPGAYTDTVVATITF